MQKPVLSEFQPLDRLAETIPPEDRGRRVERVDTETTKNVVTMDAELWDIVQAWEGESPPCALPRISTPNTDPDVHLHLSNGEVLACHSAVLSRASPDVLFEAIRARRDPQGKAIVRLDYPRLVKCCVFEVLRQIYASSGPSTISTYRWYLNLAKTYAALGIQMPDHEVSAGRHGASVKIVRDKANDSWTLHARSGLSWDTAAPLSLRARLCRQEAPDGSKTLSLMEQDTQLLNTVFGLPFVKSFQVSADLRHLTINDTRHTIPETDRTSESESQERDITQIILTAIRHCLFAPFSFNLKQADTSP
ncbi:hypothetical protein [Mollivirus kamchatka]|nr:hypothetical protein [Mollivirus kamchatka]